MSEHNGDRDKLGLFKRGNRVASGNPNAKRMAALRRELLDATTPDDVKAVGATLLELAKGGDVQAAKIWLDYVIGRPPQAVELSGPDGTALDMTTVVSVILTALGDDETARGKVAQAFRKMGSLEADGLEAAGLGG